MRVEGRISVAVMTAVILCSLMWAAPTTVPAKSPSPVEGVRFDTGTAMKENLKSLVGKDVHVHLRSGKSFQGYVKSVGDGLLHLEKLAGRDFFDALVRIEDVSALEVKFRDMK
jgi:hypothetical protein